MTMCFFRRSDLRSRFLSSRKTTFPMRRNFSVSASTEQISIPSNRNLIVVNSVVIVALAVANRVLYKLALVPMKQYPLFHGSAQHFRALFVFLLLPFLSNLKGIPFGSLLSYLKDGAGCFFNTGAKISGLFINLFTATSVCDPLSISGCDGAPILPLLYIATNLAFNISLLHLVKISSAIVSSLAVMLSGPFSYLLMETSSMSPNPHELMRYTWWCSAIIGVHNVKTIAVSTGRIKLKLKFHDGVYSSGSRSSSLQHSHHFNETTHQDLLTHFSYQIPQFQGLSTAWELLLTREK